MDTVNLFSFSFRAVTVSRLTILFHHKNRLVLSVAQRPSSGIGERWAQPNATQARAAELDYSPEGTRNSAMAQLRQATQLAAPREAPRQLSAGLQHRAQLIQHKHTPIYDYILTNKPTDEQVMKLWWPVNS